MAPPPVHSHMAIRDGNSVVAEYESRKRNAETLGNTSPLS
jgi:hypothetical protein